MEQPTMMGWYGGGMAAFGMLAMGIFWLATLGLIIWRWLRTTAWTTAERKNPSIRAYRISQVIDPASASACPIALMSARSVSIAFRIPRSDRLKLNYTPMGYRGGRPPKCLLMPPSQRIHPWVRIRRLIIE
jgi:hypothetical protein